MIKKALLLTAGLAIAGSSFAADQALTIWFTSSAANPFTSCSITKENAGVIQKLQGAPNQCGFAINYANATAQTVLANVKLSTATQNCSLQVGQYHKGTAGFLYQSYTCNNILSKAVGVNTSANTYYFQGKA